MFLNVFYVCDLYIVWLFQSCKKLYASWTRCTWTYIYKYIYTFLVLLYYGEIKLTSCVYQCYGLTCLHPYHAFKPWHANPWQKRQESPTSAIFYCTHQPLTPSIRLTMNYMSWGRSQQNSFKNTVRSQLVNLQPFTMLTIASAFTGTQKRALDHLHASLQSHYKNKRDLMY